MKYMEKAESSGKVKDTPVYINFQDTLNDFYSALKEAKKNADNFAGEDAPYNQFLKTFYVDKIKILGTVSYRINS